MDITETFINKLIIFGSKLSDEIVKIQQKDFKVKSKSDSSPLTEADILSNKRIRSFLLENSSIRNFISEEDKQVNFNSRKDWEYFWVIDPIDGTKEFVKGGDDYCVNIALCKNERPIFGYVLRPRTKDHYYACENWGAFKNGKRIMCSEIPDDKVRVVASKSHINKETEEFINKLGNAQARDIEVVNIGSALKICLVAEGRADVYPRYGPTMEWDTCAPDIILKESGGILLNTNSKTFSYNKKDLLNPFFVSYSSHFIKLFS